MNLDEIDLQIINILTKNSRTSFRKIGQQLGLSTDTVIRRYDRLESEKTIQPIILVDYQKLGYQGMAFFFIRKTGKNNLDEIFQKLSIIDDIVGIVCASGLYDIMSIACVRNVTHAFEIGKKIEKIKDIAKVTLDLLWLQPESEAVFPPKGWSNFLKQETTSKNNG